jgi:hypothetical protein
MKNIIPFNLFEMSKLTTSVFKDQIRDFVLFLEENFEKDAQKLGSLKGKSGTSLMIMNSDNDGKVYYKVEDMLEDIFDDSTVMINVFIDDEKNIFALTLDITVERVIGKFFRRSLIEPSDYDAHDIKYAYNLHSVRRFYDIVMDDFKEYINKK